MIEKIQILSKVGDACNITINLRNFFKTKNAEELQVELRGKEVDDCVEEEDVYSIIDTMSEVFKTNDIETEIEKISFLCSGFFAIFDAVLFDNDTDAEIVVWGKSDNGKDSNITRYEREYIDNVFGKCVFELLLSQLSNTGNVDK